MHIIEGMHDRWAYGFTFARREAESMKKADVRSILLMILSASFICLLIAGAPRLIADADACASAEIPPMPVRMACLCSAPSPSQESGAQAVRSPLAAGRGELLCAPDPCRMGERPGQNRDANGNVLLSGSYLHEVYQAFPLGDGFA